MTATSSSAPGVTTLRDAQRRETRVGYAFIAVPMALFLTLNIFAIFYAFFISFFDWGIRGPREFLGLANYQDLLFDDPVFVGKAVVNTLRYAIIVVPAQMALGLFLAVVVNQKLRAQTFFRAAFYFPAIASSAAIAVLFTFITQPDGLFNAFLGTFGIASDLNWTNNSSTALESVMVLNVWTTSGTMMLFYLASLQAISREVYEAAALDGAGPWQAFWGITFPLLRPAHYFVAVVSFIGALQMFDQAFILGGGDGSPANSLSTVVLYLYRAALVKFDFGYAAAVGIILFIAIMAITLVQRRLFGQAPAW
ncbi:MAG: sugar ABC transporter permease [Chloroflexota bacterium]|nr:sugar ABC transporter permease [Chloroflexota bacterium]